MPPTVARYTCQILTSDPASGVIEANVKGALVQPRVVTTSVAFRWPVAGETWLVRQENGNWYIDSPAPSALVSTVNPGDAIIDSPTGVVWVTGSDPAAPSPFSIDQNSVYQPGDLIVSAAATRAGCLLCDGSPFDPSLFPGLFGAIAHDWGTDGPTGHPLRPDFRGRSPIGAGAGVGLTVRTRGQTGGNEVIGLTATQIPSHTHGYSGTTGNDSPDHSHSGTTNAADRSLDHLHGMTSSGRTLGQYTSGWGNWNVQPSSAGAGSTYGSSTSGGALVTDSLTGAMDRSIDHLHTFGTGGASARHAHGFSGTTDAGTGGNATHPNMHPFAVVNWFIKT
jgi:microcystin-dependent protein